MSNFPLSKVAEQRIDGKLQIFPSNIRPIFRSSLEKKLLPPLIQTAPHTFICFELNQIFHQNPPAPFSCGGHVRPGQAAKKVHGTGKCCRVQDRPNALSIRHGRNIGPTWLQSWPARPQLQSNLGPVGSNFGPTWLQDRATWSNLKPFGIWLQTWGHCQLNP